MGNICYSVEGFYYNGFYVLPTGKTSPYTAEFDHWSNDPGIMVCKCSDGIMRSIPTCQLLGYDKNNHPLQPKLAERNLGLIHVGEPCEG